ncbi:MAG: hypothetical protein WD529_06945 [Balneolaceae bacterium]
MQQIIQFPGGNFSTGKAWRPVRFVLNNRMVKVELSMLPDIDLLTSRRCRGLSNLW